MGEIQQRQGLPGQMAQFLSNIPQPVVLGGSPGGSWFWGGKQLNVSSQLLFEGGDPLGVWGGGAAEGQKTCALGKFLRHYFCVPNPPPPASCVLSLPHRCRFAPFPLSPKGSL